MKRERVFQEIMQQAIGEMREALEQETGYDGAGQWDPDAWRKRCAGLPGSWVSGWCKHGVR